jgi:citrate lyase subunit beta/citryl-CoA lyase
LRPRRSILFVPGSSPRMLEKARGLASDAVVLDLEDAVAPDAKEAARVWVAEAVKGFGSREVMVRINPPQSEWGAEDLAMMRAARPDAIILPKVQSVVDVATVRVGLPLWAMIETPMALLNLAAIAASGVKGLLLGSNDLLAMMRGTPLPDRRNLWAAMSQVVTAARAHDLSAIDGTYNDVTDETGFVASCAQAKAFGFDGKSLIHPAQIAICNRAFAPSAEEIAQARRIIAAFAAEPGKEALALDGRMIERLHAGEAARLLALAHAIMEQD